MGTSEHIYSQSRSGWRWLATGSLLAVVALSVFLWSFTGHQRQDRGKTLVVFCAAGIRLPVEEAAERYEEELGVHVRLEYGSSGELEGKMLLEKQSKTVRSDLYIPADQSFTERARGKGLVRESMPLARFRLVVGVKPGNPKGIRSLEDLLRDDVPYVICNEEAGCGKKTMEVLAKVGLWKKIRESAKAEKPRVTEAGNDVRASDSVAAGIVWDTTARQFGLDIVELPELAGGAATITAAVTTTCERPAAALRFARYLAAPERGQPLFARHDFERIDGDAWTEVPEITFFSGGVNREAVERTLDEFQSREGCLVKPMFAGCGTLVQAIQAGERGKPDLFLTCDASYLTMVEEDFGDASDVSTTAMVLVVRTESEKEIRTLQDLARPEVAVGIADPEQTALGALTVQLLKDVGVYEPVAEKMVTAPTAHELILQMEGHSKHDVIVAYEANCQNLGRGLRMIPIDHPGARAVQNIAVGRVTRYPYLTERLLEAIASERSASRFQSHGFSWLAGEKNIPGD